LLAVALLVPLPLLAGEPSPVENQAFFPETAWNRSNAALQYNVFFLGRASTWELAQEWAGRRAQHQLSYSIPVYRDEGESGLGDVTVSYRYQWIGGEGSRAAVAPRVSLMLPTRSRHFGQSSRGIEVAVPFSAALTERLVSHASIATLWFHDRDETEIKLAESLIFAVRPRVMLTADALYTRAGGGDILIVRPGAQVTLEGPAGLQIAPGIAFPLSAGSRRIVAFVALEIPF
jgi:hypothetical protein